MLSSTLRLLVVIAALIHADAWKVFERWHQVQAAAAAAARRLPRALRETLDAKDGTGDYYDELLKITASYGGRMKKTEILPTWKYTRNFNLEPFEEWVRNVTLGTVSALSTPPMSYKCGVFINMEYRFIFIRNRKAASTSTLAALHKALAKTGCKGQGCKAINRMQPDTLRAKGLDPDELWRNFTVISSVRNPWARAASGFDYTYKLWPKQAEQSRGCAKPTFVEFSRDPMVMGRISNLNGCARNRSTTRGSGDEWEHDFYHVEPAFNCLFQKGKSAVDFLVRYESLKEDTDDMIALINERRPPHLPALQPPATLAWQKRGTTFQVTKQKLREGRAQAAGGTEAEGPSEEHAGGEEDGGASGGGGGGSEATDPEGDSNDRDSDQAHYHSQDGAAESPHGEEGGSGGGSGGGGSGGESESTVEHVAKYRACGRECVDNIAKFFKEDLKLLGFKHTGLKAPWR